MMKLLWRYMNKQPWTMENKQKLFVGCNVLVFCMIGMLLWWGIGFWTLKTIDWFICFIGYPGFFGGYLGGILYLWKKGEAAD